METKFYEDLIVGDTFETHGRTLSESDLYRYAGLGGNYHPVHVDAEYENIDGFEERLVHGNLVLVILEGLRIQKGLFKHSVVASYGYNLVRFLSPTYIDDTVYGEFTVEAKEPRDEESGIVTLTEKAINQHDEAALVAKSRIVIKRRE
jgi:acyl dehydratase